MKRKKMGRKPERFCKRGHEISAVGRNKWGECNQCKKEKYTPHPHIIVQFCVHGHEIAAVGRDKWGECNGCRKPVSLGIRPLKIRKFPPPKQFCPKGHDTFICGRNAQKMCKLCDVTHSTKYAKKHKKARKKYAKKYRKTHAKSIRKWIKQHAKELKEVRRRWNLKKLYGISLEMCEELLSKQKGLCAGCLKPQSDFKRPFGVDHDHKTGKIRGLLCVGCNRGMGMLKDDPEILRRLAKYLIKANKRKKG